MITPLLLGSAVPETRNLYELLAGEYEFPRCIPTEGKELAQLSTFRAPPENRLQVSGRRYAATAVSASELRKFSIECR
jgi:hypothetical protein